MNTQKILIALLTLLFSSLSFAKAGGFALGVSAGTLGLGLDAVYGLTERLNLRGSYHAYDYSTDIENKENSNGLQYNGDLELDNFGLGLDFHPFASAFRLSIGFQNSDNKLVGVAVCTEVSCGFGDNVVGPNDSARVEVDLSGTHPYATLGWGNAVSDGGPIGIFFDLGVMFQGTPKVDVTATCVSAPQLLCNDEAEKEEKELQKEAEDFEVFPIVNLGLRWRFN